MRVTWHITESDVSKVREFYSARKDNPFVRRRIRRNVEVRRSRLQKRRIWFALVMCLATTQQRSGPKSLVSRFMKARPFPLAYDVCSRKRQLEPWAERVLRRYRLRRSTVMAVQIEENFDRLEAGLWKDVRTRLRSLLPRAKRLEERAVADFLSENLVGIGPKQARNLLQFLGLTRYEIPLDSRITKWLNEFGFPMPLSAMALGNREYYVYVLDKLQLLCARARIYPCILDAAIFASFDEEETDPAS